MSMAIDRFLNGFRIRTLAAPERHVLLLDARQRSSSISSGHVHLKNGKLPRQRRPAPKEQYRRF